MSRVPEDLAEVVHRVASATAGHAADLGEIQRRGRWRRRRRRVAASAACAVILVAAGIVAVPALSERHRTDQPLAEPAQRLMITGPVHGVEFPPGSALEVRPDGSLAKWVPVRTPASSVQARSLPDGRVVTLLGDAASRALIFAMSGSVGESASPPVITPVSGEGMVELEANGSRTGQLVGASPDAAYVWSPDGLVAYTLATGARRVVVRLRDAGFEDQWASGIGRMDVAGQTLLSWPRSTECRFVVTELGTGATERHTMSGDACDVSAARISPDGRLAGVAYLRSARGPLRVAVVELASGAVRADVALPAPGDIPATPLGLAWQDMNHLRVAVAAPPDANRPYQVAEVLKVHTVDAT